MFELLTPFVEAPWLALVPALVFAGLGKQLRSRAALTMAALWLAYGLFEFGNKARITCSGECNIRIDLLVIAPVLLLGSVVAAIALIRRSLRKAPA